MLQLDEMNRGVTNWAFELTWSQRVRPRECKNLEPAHAFTDLTMDAISRQRQSRCCGEVTHTPAHKGMCTLFVTFLLSLQSLELLGLRDVNDGGKMTVLLSYRTRSHGAVVVVVVLALCVSPHRCIHTLSKRSDIKLCERGGVSSGCSVPSLRRQPPARPHSHQCLLAACAISQMATASAASGTGEVNMEVVVKRFQELRAKEQTMVNKVAELTSQEAEYR